MKKRIYIFILLLIVQFSYAQNKQRDIDSLQTELPKVKHDTSRVSVLRLLALNYSYSNPDTAILINKKALDLAKKIKWQKGIVFCYHNSSRFFYLKGDLKACLAETKKEEAVVKEMMRSKDLLMQPDILKGRSMVENDYGNIATAQGEFAKALKHYFTALRFLEKLKNKGSIVNMLTNISANYMNQGDYEKAEIYNLKALPLAKAINDRSTQAMIFGNLAIIDFENNKFDNCIANFEKAYHMQLDMGEKSAAAITCANAGQVMRMMNRPKEAIPYLKEAMAIQEEIGDKLNLAGLLNQLGSTYTHLGQFNEAEKAFKAASVICEEQHAMADLKITHEGLAILYENMGKDALSLGHLKRYVSLRDSLSSIDNLRNQIQTELQYDFDKKQATDSIKTAVHNEEEKLAHEQTIQRQKLLTYAGIGGFLIMLVFALISIRSYRQKRKANKIIAQQKLIVEEKQREVLDSIYYARRIQQALLPSEKMIGRNLNQVKK